MKMARKTLMFMLFLILYTIPASKAQDYNETKGDTPPPEENCDGIFVSYQFISRQKEFPRIKNASAQAWAFKSIATVLNTGTTELKAWKIYIGFQHREILVSATGAVLVDGDDFPASVGNGTYLSGYPLADLKTSIDTAGDLTQIQAKIEITGTQFGVMPPGNPMPKTIRLENDGFKCPGPTSQKSSLFVCCVRDPKYKIKAISTKYLPRQKGDLLFSYDVIQAYEGSYLAQVTMLNSHPLGRLDHWNLTWEWMRGEFINTMRGAYTHKKDYTECIYGAAGVYYKDMDFSQVMNCQKKPVITDLPPEKEKDEKVGNLPSCCRNGTLLPTTMNETKAKAIFQLQVQKVPPDMNRTALYAPEKWNITGILNPQYKCGAPIRVDPSEFPDPSGLQSLSTAVASWQIVCNITRPPKGGTRCCVSFSAYYNESVIPCNTCACGCPDKEKCNTNAPPMLLPPETLLVPFENRTEKALAWARIKHYHIPNPLPCGDNCGVSINWHVNTDYKSGWTARLTLFNWLDINFADWFGAIEMKVAYKGYEKLYSFNGTALPQLNNIIFFQGLEGMTYLMGLTNGTDNNNIKVPGKQQSIISFKKSDTPGINVPKGDGFPSRVFFNGEECALPTQFPTGNGDRYHVNILTVIFITLVFHIM